MATGRVEIASAEYVSWKHISQLYILATLLARIMRRLAAMLAECVALRRKYDVVVVFLHSVHLTAMALYQSQGRDDLMGAIIRPVNKKQNSAASRLKSELSHTRQWSSLYVLYR